MSNGGFILFGIMIVIVGWGMIQEAQEPPSPSFSREEIRLEPVEVPISNRPRSDKGSIPYLGEVSINVSPMRSNSQGTAFSIHEKGVWLTARHVVDGCKRINIVPQKGSRSIIPVISIRVHPSSDVSVLVTEGGKQPLSLESEAVMDHFVPGKTVSFAMGFPADTPGEVYGNLMGKVKMRHKGKYSSNEVALVWAIKDHTASLRSLGGISGGPVLNSAGKVIGLNSAGSSSLRRGRLITSTLSSIKGIVKDQAASLQSAVQTLSFANYKQVATALRAQTTIARVYCYIR